MVESDLSYLRDPHGADATSRSTARTVAGSVAVAVGWLALVATTALWGRHLPTAHLHLGNAPPLIGRLRDRPQIRSLAPALGLGTAVAVVGPRLAGRLRWPVLLGIAWVAAAGWAVALAASDGWRRVAEPLTRRFEYLAVLPRVGAHPGGFVRHFTANLPSYPTHVKGHGPLAPLAFWAVARLGLPMPAAAAGMVIALGASAAVAVAVTVRALAGEPAARRMVPVLVLLPAALWVATSADAMFLGVSAWGVALVALATTRRDRYGDALAFAAGVLIAAGLFMSYGLLVLLGLPVAVCVVQRRWRPLVIAACGGLVIVAAFAIAGFSYPAGFAATHAAWAAGWGPQRSRTYFLVSDLADLALLVGPAVPVAAFAARDRRLVVIMLSAVLAVLASDASGFVRGEAERIWLPFAPWLAVAAGATRWSRRTVTVALLAQVAVAVAVQSLVRSPW